MDLTLRDSQYIRTYGIIQVGYKQNTRFRGCVSNLGRVLGHSFHRSVCIYLSIPRLVNAVNVFVCPLVGSMDRMGLYETFEARMDSHLNEIAELEQKVKSMKEACADIMVEVLGQSQSYEVSMGILNLVYWHYPQISALLIADLLNIQPQKLCVMLGPTEITTACVSCSIEMEITVTSRNNLKAVTGGRDSYLSYQAKDEQMYCPGCLKAKTERKAAERQEYERGIERKREYIRQLRAMPYADYLKTDHWQDIRRRALKRSGFKCQLCNKDNTGLHVHHRTYANRGNEQNSDVIVLCADCHQEFHERMEVQS